MTTEQLNNFTVEQLEQAISGYGTIKSVTLRAQLIKSGMMNKSENIHNAVNKIKEVIEAKKAEAEAKKAEHVEEEEEESNTSTPKANIESLDDKKGMNDEDINERVAEIYKTTKAIGRVLLKLKKEGITTDWDHVATIISKINASTPKANIEHLDANDANDVNDANDANDANDVAVVDDVDADDDVDDVAVVKVNPYERYKKERDLSTETLPYRLFGFGGHMYHYTINPCITDDTKCVEVIVPGALSKTKIDIEIFNRVFKDYAIEKLQYQTEEARKEIYDKQPRAHRQPYINDVMMLRVPTELRGIRYLDIDSLKVSNVDELITIVKPIISKLSTLKCYILTFLPEDIDDRIKGVGKYKNNNHAGAGVHTYIIYNPEDIDGNKWNEMTEYLRQTLKGSFDDNPWNSSSINLPFCHKSYTSANYYLNLSLCYPSTIEEIRKRFQDFQFVANALTSKQIDEDKNKQPKFFTVCDGKGLNARIGEIEAIAEGFNGIVIHSTQMGKITGEHLGVVVIASAINSLANEEERDKLSRLIYKKAIKTSKASDNWDITFERAKPTQISVLWNIIKYHKPDYYARVYPQFERKTFQNSSYNIKDFQCDTIETLPQLMEKLSLCVAVNLDGGIIVKNDDGYKVMSRYEFLSIYDTQFTLKMSEEEQEEANKKAIEQHKKKPKGDKTITLANIIKNHNICQQLSAFNDVKVYSDDPKVLSLYIPPALTDINQRLIDRFIRYFMGQVKYTRPLLELFNTIAFKLRHPGVFVPKFFILHGQGHDGKSFLVGAVKEIFNKYGRIVHERDMTEDNFNSWQEDMLFIWMEEVQNIANKNKLEELIKTITTKNTGRRGMHKELTEGCNNAIVGFNTNDDSLSGLCRASEAVKQRLVIIEFNKPTDESKKEVNEISRLSELLKNSKSEAAKSFIFTLYNYFLKQYEIPDDFTTERYDGPEKEVIINQKQIANTSIFENWIIEENDKLVKHGCVKGVPTAYIVISMANESWASKTQNKNITVKWENELIRLGWRKAQNCITGRKERVMLIDLETWNKWLHEREGESVEIDYFIDE